MSAVWTRVIQEVCALPHSIGKNSGAVLRGEDEEQEEVLPYWDVTNWSDLMGYCPWTPYGQVDRYVANMVATPRRAGVVSQPHTGIPIQ